MPPNFNKPPKRVASSETASEPTQEADPKPIEAAARPEIRTALLNQSGSYPLEKVQGLFTGEEIASELDEMIFSDLADRAIEIADKIGDRQTAVKAAQVIRNSGAYGEAANALAEKYKSGSENSPAADAIKENTQSPERRQNVGSEIFALVQDLGADKEIEKIAVFRRLVEGPDTSVEKSISEPMLERIRTLEFTYGREQVLEVATIMGAKA